jgi:K+/H+ antiporter YhaU regulatory subunit KhtT
MLVCIIEQAPFDQTEVWNDLAVIFRTGRNEDDEEEPTSRENTAREFLAAMEIIPKSSLIQKSVDAHGLNKLPGIFLVSIERPKHDESANKALVVSNPLDNQSAASVDGSLFATDTPMEAISQYEPLREGDVMWFSGTAQSVGDLRKIPGMKSYVNEEVKKINEKVHDRRLVQAVIARRAKLVGKTVKETKFRTKFGAAVIAVHREGKRVQEHPGKIKLQAGDVLLLEAGPSFVKQNADNDHSFALLSEVEDSKPPRLKLLIPSLILAVAMLIIYTAGVASLLVCALVASLLMVTFGILSQQEVRDAINWEIYITIACAFGIGTALTNSGVAGGIADGLVSLGQAVGIGDAGLFGAVYFATFLISNVVTNNAAAALLFPIAMDAAETTGADKQLMSYILMLGASASFMSPFGYTTNLLIYGPGGYKVRIDFCESFEYRSFLQLKLILLHCSIMTF